MNFQFEESTSRIWPTMQKEHDLLENAIKSKRRRGVLEYLDHRVVDHTRNVALYYVTGFGMSAGRTFALLHAGEILWINVMRDKFAKFDVTKVSVPEKLNARRDELLALVVESVTAYDHLQSPYCLETTWTLSVERTVWEVIPQRFSWLFWKTESDKWMQRQWPKIEQPIDVFKSPMVACLALFGSVLFALVNAYSPAWPLIIGGAWLWCRTDAYDELYYFWPWFVGFYKCKSPWTPGLNLLERTTAMPLNRLRVGIELDPADNLRCTLRIKNTTAFFVPHVSISPVPLAGLLAPGLVDSLRDADGRLQSQKVSAIFGDLTRKWLLPFQTVEWHLRLLPEFPLIALAPQVDAIVSISRRVSGRRYPGAQLYALPVTRTEPAHQR